MNPSRRNAMHVHLVSIIIPCYNAETYVGQAIESALAQTYRPVEVVVVDDGSTDGSLDIIKSFGDRIRCISGPNRGGGAARNRGLELADGALIQFLDADDILHPRKLERQVEVIGDNRNLLVFCDGETWDEQLEGKLYVHARNFEPAMDPVLFMLGGGLPTEAALHWKRNLRAVGGFREHLRCSQERDLHLRLACQGLWFRRIPESLYTIRRVAGSVSGDTVRVLDQHSEIAWNAERMLTTNGGLTDARAAALAGFLAADARAYLQHGLPQKSREYFSQAAQLHPDGGIPQAYSGKTRVLYRLLGAKVTQRLVGLKRTASVLPTIWHRCVCSSKTKLH